MLVLTQAMNLVFVPFLGHAGLALSVGLGATINAVWLFAGLKRGGWYRPMPGWRRFTTVIVLATLVMGGLLAGATAAIDWIGLAGHDGLRIAWLAACLIAATLVYFGVLFAAGFRPRDFFRGG